MKLVQKAIIMNGDKFLVLLRSKDDLHYPLHWDFPGGKNDAGEEACNALIREVSEETGLDIKPIKMVWTKDLEAYGEKIRFFVYATELISGEIKLSNEHSDFRWISKDNLLKMKIEPYIEIFFKECKD